MRLNSHQDSNYSRSQASEALGEKGNREKPFGRTGKSPTPVLARQPQQLAEADASLQVCREHYRPLEIYCLNPNCMDLVCANCALFGSHRGHKVRERQALMEETASMVDDLRLVADSLNKAQRTVRVKAEVDGWCHRMADCVKAKESEINMYFEVETLVNERNVLNDLN